MSEVGTYERPTTVAVQQADPSGRGGPRRGRSVARRLGLGLVLLAALVALLLAGGRAFGLYGGLVERTETTAWTATGRAVEVAGLDIGRVEVGPADGPGVRLELTRHGFGRDEGRARQALGDVGAEVRQDGETVRVAVREPGGVVLFGRSPYATLRVFAPAGVQVRTR